MRAVEIRSSGSLHTQGKNRVCGYAAVFDKPSQDLGGFIEVIRAGAFTASLQNETNIRALYHHDMKSLLGTTRANTLRLNQDEKGLAFELDLPDTTDGKDLAVLIDRGDIAGCSFGFRVKPDGDRWERRSSQVIRELLDVELIEITLTSNPAYQDTTVARRDLDHFSSAGKVSCPNQTLYRRFMETL